MINRNEVTDISLMVADVITRFQLEESAPNFNSARMACAMATYSMIRKQPDDGPGSLDRQLDLAKLTMKFERAYESNHAAVEEILAKFEKMSPAERDALVESEFKRVKDTFAGDAQKKKCECGCGVKVEFSDGESED